MGACSFGGLSLQFLNLGKDGDEGFDSAGSAVTVAAGRLCVMVSVKGDNSAGYYRQWETLE